MTIPEKNHSTNARPIAVGPALEDQEYRPLERNSNVNTISSCNDYPLPIYARKHEIFENVEESERRAFEQLKAHQKIPTRDRLKQFFSRDTLKSWKNKTVNFFTGKNKAVDNVSNSSPIALPPVTPAEQKLIKEIEDAIVAYELELKNAKNGSDMKIMMEMIAKIQILLASLGHRLSKKEMENLFDHMEINVKKRVKTFEGGKIWTYVSVAIQGAGALLSFAPLAIGPLGGKETALGLLAKNLGKASQGVSAFGGAASKMGDVDSEKRTAIRTFEDHEGEKLKQTRSDRERLSERTQQTAQQILSTNSEMERSRHQATNAAAG